MTEGTLISLALGVLLLSGCVTTEVQEQKQKKVFYPEPPDLPRYQFLRSYKGAVDFDKEQSAFDAFIVGKQKAGQTMEKPYGLAIYDGVIYVADTNISLIMLDLNKEKFDILPGSRGLGKLVLPINIAIDPDGNKYVADPVRKQILQYDRGGFFLKEFKVPRDWKPVDVEVVENRLYVADNENHEVVVFDRDSGDVLQRLGKEGLERQQQLELPVNIAISPDGFLYVVDAGRFQVIKYDLDGHFIETIGKAGRSPGEFARPKGIAIDRDGLIYVVDAAFSNIQVFHSSGQLLTIFGNPGKEPGNLDLPAGISIDYDKKNIELFRKDIDENFEVEYLILVSNQIGDRLVSVFGCGKQKGENYESFETLLEKRKKLLQEEMLQNKEKK